MKFCKISIKIAVWFICQKVQSTWKAGPRMNEHQAKTSTTFEKPLLGFHLTTFNFSQVFPTTGTVRTETRKGYNLNDLAQAEIV